MTYKVGSLFAGIGGTCLGFKQAGAEIVWANEFDKNACITYRENFGDSYLLEGDITQVDKNTIPDIDILLAGFPCQAFSIAGYRKGFDDDRGNLFFQILDVLEAKKPKAFLLENVKNLVSHDNGHTFKIIQQSLEAHGYSIKAKVLNSMTYGNVPQNRERIYIVGFLDHDKTDNFQFPNEIPLTNTLNHIIDRENKLEDKFYYKESSQYYSMLKESIKSTETTYQLRRIYVRENKNNVCPTLTANMGTGGHNVPLILDIHGNIRKLTPRECLLLQGFPQDYKIPQQSASSHIYKQAGNSVTVSVIKRIAENIIDVMNNLKIEASLKSQQFELI